MPLEAAYSLLAAIIDDLSRKYAGPTFEPHVTLLGDLPGPEDEIVARTYNLAREMEPYDIYFTTPAQEDQYFRCLYIKVKETPEVMGANALCRRTFNQSANHTYRPHLSLLYGNHSSSIKTEIIAALPPFESLQFTVTTLYLIKAESTNPKDWHKIHSFSVSGNIAY
jgi:2'-5' RNA ligase